MVIPEGKLPSTLKVCSWCSRCLHKREFGPHKKTKDGLQSWCRRCTRERVREVRNERGND